MTLVFLWSKMMKKVRGASIRNSRIDRYSKINAGTTFYDSTMGRYSYCGYDCLIVKTNIGAFCSIADCVVIGGASHPVHWVSTSPAFYVGRNGISRKLALHEFQDNVVTQIGNDVWIGRGAFIRAGVSVGDGAVIGMGSIVTHDVAPYTIVAGNPARAIRLRFDPDIVKELLQSAWWTWPEDVLKEAAKAFTTVDVFAKQWRDTCQTR